MVQLIDPPHLMAKKELRALARSLDKNMIKLLIVDDSALMRRQLMTLFQAEGDFEIRQARNGDEAVRENREFQPHVVTLDINMPEMTD